MGALPGLEPTPTAPTTPSRPTAGIQGARSTVFERLVGVFTFTVLLLIVYPLFRVAVRIFFPDGSLDLSQYRIIFFESPWFPSVLFNSIIAVTGGGLFAIVVGSIFAWLNERTDASFGIMGRVIPLTPLLMPTIALAIGWSFLASPRNGYLNTMISAAFGWLAPDFRLNIFSWIGLSFVYGLYFIPYVYLMVGAALRNLDPALEEASRMSDSGLLRTLRKISLPAVTPAVLGSGLLVVMVGLSLYSVPVIIATQANIDIMSVRIIRMLTRVFPAQTDRALALSTILLVIIVSVWLIQRRVVQSGQFATVGTARHGYRINLGIWRWPAKAMIFGYILLTSILPFAALLLVSVQPFWNGRLTLADFTLRHYDRVLFGSQTTRGALQYSTLLGTVTGAVGITIAIVLALYAQRVGGNRSRIVEGVTKLPAAVSNIVIGVAFLIALGAAPFRLAGTLLILFLAYIVIYMPQASVAATAAVGQIGNQLTEASFMSGAGQGRTLRRIQFPLLLPGIAAGWALLFVLMAGDLAASAILSGVGNPVIGFVILDIWESGSYGQLAAFSVIVSALMAAVVAIIMVVSRPRYQRKK